MEKPSLPIYCKLTSANLTAEGELVLVLEKDSTSYLTTTILCSLIRELFEGKDVYLYITLLARREEAR